MLNRKVFVLLFMGVFVSALLISNVAGDNPKGGMKKGVKVSVSNDEESSPHVRRSLYAGVDRHSNKGGSDDSISEKSSPAKGSSKQSSSSSRVPSVSGGGSMKPLSWKDFPNDFSRAHPVSGGGGIVNEQHSSSGSKKGHRKNNSKHPPRPSQIDSSMMSSYRSATESSMVSSKHPPRTSQIDSSMMSSHRSATESSMDFSKYPPRSSQIDSSMMSSYDTASQSSEGSSKYATGASSMGGSWKPYSSTNLDPEAIPFNSQGYKDDYARYCPKSAVVPENIDAVEKLIMQDRHVTYREIEASLGISPTSIHTILHEHLAVKKICSRWIPHNLTIAQKKARVVWSEEMLKKYNRGASKDVYNIVTGDKSWIYAYEPESKQQSTVWVFQSEPNPTKVVRARITAKQMVACFFGKTGHVATVPLEQRRTVNSEWYTTICLPEVFNEMRNKNKRRRIILHHDNASSHTSHQTTENLTDQNIELMGHPPYSPDLAPNDFFLFPHIKDKLRGQRFASAEEAVDAFKNHVFEVSLAEWKKCFDKWFERMQKCIDHHGEYFEKQ